MMTLKIKKRLNFILFFILAFSWGSLLAAPAAHKIDALFAPWNKNTSPGAVLMVIKDGKVAYKHAYGMARLDKQIPLSNNSRFDLASTSKQFTAFCIGLLIEQQQLSLSDDIRTFFPELPTFDKGIIRIEHLLYHTSGLPDYMDLMDEYLGKDEYDLYSLNEVLGLFSQINKLDFAPGKRFDYSNTNYLFLGEIVHRITGKTLRQYAQENIFKPLGMKNSFFLDDCNEVVPNMAFGYSPSGKGKFKKDMVIIDLVGDGNLYTTVDDLYLWDQNFYNNKLGSSSQELIELTTKPGRLSNGSKVDYAFGLDTTRYLGRRTISHDGSSIGYGSVMMRFPDDRLTVIILSNLDTFEPIDLALDVAELYLEK